MKAKRVKKVKGRHKPILIGAAILAVAVGSVAYLRYSHSESARRISSTTVELSTNPDLLGANQVDRIDTNLLNQAKNSSRSLETIHAILDVDSEWRKVRTHRERRSSVKKLISSALSAASEGRFKSAEFILNETTNSIVAEDRAVFSPDLMNKYNVASQDLRALLARETVRTGLQAGDEYYVEVNRSTIQRKKSSGGFLWFGGDSYTEEKIRDTKQLVLFVPELSTGAPVYDEESQKIFQKPKKYLTAADFQNDIIAVAQPYSKVEGNEWGFHEYLISAAARVGENIVRAFLGARPNTAPLTGFPILWSQWRNENARFIDGPPLVKFQKVVSRPMFELDRQAWGGAIYKKLADVRSDLEEMWQRADQGYRFRVDSSSYSTFIGYVKQYQAALEQIASLKRTRFLTDEQIYELKLNYPALGGGRPNNLEAAIEVAVKRAEAAGEVQVADLIKHAISFNENPLKDIQLDTQEVATLSTMAGKEISAKLRTYDASNIRDHLVELYMLGREDVVKAIFNQLSYYSQSVFAKIQASMDANRDAVLVAMNNPTRVDVSAQLASIAAAKAAMEQAQANAFLPDHLLQNEEYKSALETVSKTATYKRIYKYKDEVEHVQRELRLAFGKAKKNIGEVIAKFKEAPTAEVRTALLDVLTFYKERMKELNSEFWPYKAMKPLQLAVDAQGRPMVTRDDHGVEKPVYTQDFEIREMVLFNEKQVNEYKLDGVVSAESVELTYLDSYFRKMTDTMTIFAGEIDRQMRRFLEYPSHTVSVSLKSSLGNFYQLRESITQRMNGVAVHPEAVASAKIAALRAQYAGELNGISWVGELTGAAKKDERTLIAEVENARPRYNDLIQ